LPLVQQMHQSKFLMLIGKKKKKLCIRIFDIYYLEC
jgi:hypothetical protein